MCKGTIVGLNNRDNVFHVNLYKAKQLSNTHASGTDQAVRLSPPTLFTLEEAIEFISDDELVEVTPLNIRMWKRFLTKEAKKQN